MPSCDSLMRIVLTVANIIFILIGVSILAVGIWVKVDQQFLLDLTHDVSSPDTSQESRPSSMLENALMVLIVTGGLVFIIGIFGFLGALTSKTKCGKLLLKIYAVVVVLILVLEVSGVCLAWMFFDKLEVTLKQYLRDSLQTQYQGNFTPSGSGSFIYSASGDSITLAWDIIQLEFECCGLNNSTDYRATDDLTWNTVRNHTTSDGTRRSLAKPPSCCKMEGGSGDTLASLKAGGTRTTFTPEYPECPHISEATNVTGCYQTVKQRIKDNAIIFLCTGGAMLFIELLCITIACSQVKTDKDQIIKMNNE